jgi:hypothetical protein
MLMAVRYNLSLIGESFVTDKKQNSAYYVPDVVRRWIKNKNISVDIDGKPESRPELAKASEQEIMAFIKSGSMVNIHQDGAVAEAVKKWAEAVSSKPVEILPSGEGESKRLDGNTEALQVADIDASTNLVRQKKIGVALEGTVVRNKKGALLHGKLDTPALAKLAAQIDGNDTSIPAAFTEMALSGNVVIHQNGKKSIYTPPPMDGMTTTEWSAWVQADLATASKIVLKGDKDNEVVSATRGWVSLINPKAEIVKTDTPTVANVTGTSFAQKTPFGGDNDVQEAYLADIKSLVEAKKHALKGSEEVDGPRSAARGKPAPTASGRGANGL